MAVQVGVIQIPTVTELRDQYLRDIRLAAIEAGLDEPPVGPGTDYFLDATATANLSEVGLANIALASKDLSVLEGGATGAALDKIREAYGLPEVSAAGSSGKIKLTITGSTTIPSGTVLKLPNGLRIETVGTALNPSDGAEIDVTAIDTGEATNWPGGTVVQFVSPPSNVERDARVSYGSPLTGGTDIETDARKRARILNTLRNKPAGGNWAYLRQLVLDNVPSVQDCYVYPAIGGPASQVVVPVKSYDRANNDYSRAPSSAALQTIRGLIQSDASTAIETVVRASADQEVDFTIKVDIPDSALSGGNGQGWTDPAPWPSLEVADSNSVAVSAVTDNDNITVDAQTATAPVDGQTHIAWWSPADRKFYTALVVSHSGSAGAWVLELDQPLLGKDGVGPAIGDYICPAAQNLEKYGDAWVALFEELGPGQMTSDADRLQGGRASRHPLVGDEDPSDITNVALGRISSRHPEITDIEFGVSATTSPTVPATVDDPPNVLVPGNFAVYPL